MSRKLLPVLTILTAGSLFVCWRKFFTSKETLIDRRIIRNILITLRKRFFSTLREIAYIVQNLKAHQGLTTKKIAEILMKNGSSAEIKLNAIEETVLRDNNVQKRTDFEFSCNQYGQNDIEIKILLETLKMDIEMALEGSLQSYNKPMPELNSDALFELYREVIQRRMSVIDRNCCQNPSQNLSQQQAKNNLQELLRNQVQIEEFLQMKGLYDEKQPCEKILLTLVERNCLQSEYFELKMQQFQNQLQNAIKSGEAKEYFIRK